MRDIIEVQTYVYADRVVRVEGGGGFQVEGSFSEEDGKSKINLNHITCQKKVHSVYYKIKENGERSLIEEPHYLVRLSCGKEIRVKESLI